MNTRFLLNQQTVETDLPTGSTLLDFIRYHKRLTGTKIGCREGDCGACTVLVGDFENGHLVYRSATSCLMPLGNALGKHIVTVEGVNMQHLSPVQQALVETNGTQCGFCTIGFVMSLTGFMLSGQNLTIEAGIQAVDGNICRCTGYQSIIRAIAQLVESVAEVPQESRLQALAERQYIPAYFSEIPKRLSALKSALIAQERRMPVDHDVILGGGSDLLVQRPGEIRQRRPRLVSHESDWKTIHREGDEMVIGASATVTALAESVDMQALFPNLAAIIRLVSSTQIRNKATLAGNLVNASPIGDFSMFFLALDAQVVLENRAGDARRIPLRSFYTGYKQLAKAADEHIRAIRFKVPSPHFRFNFEKVCKRTHLDIASVNSGFSCLLDAEGRMQKVHFSGGGVAPFPKYLAETSAFLTGKKPVQETFEAAIPVLQQEIAPISDVRGTADYKRLLLQQLLFAHLQALV